jgi:signal transduction histidine kinase
MSGELMPATPRSGRENDPMTHAPPSSGGNFPPPSGAPVGEAGPSGDGEGSSFWDSFPFDDPKEAAEWWFGGLRKRETWVSLGYLAAGAVLGPLMFVAVIVMLAVSLPLILVIVGIPLAVLAFTAIDRLAGFERTRAEWVGAPIAPRPHAPRVTSWWRRLLVRLADPTRWRQVAYLLASVVVGPVFFALGALPLNLAIQSLFGADLIGFDFFIGIRIGGLVVALVLAGAISRVAIFAADLAHSYVAWFLGPDRAEELEARVESLSGQRQEILDAVSSERRRIERNLHDGVQQQLVALGIDIGRASARIDDDPDGARQLLDEARNKVRASVGELRVIGRGLHPAVLDDRGLDAALSAVVSGAPIPIEVSVEVESPIADGVAETAYYVANEAVANVLKHSKARIASIRITETPSGIGGTALLLVVHDDGHGGASIESGGTGLAGMAARVRGVDGNLTVDSPRGGPTTVTAEIPM